jgi:mono/diheme cytochrome c family protein
MVVTAVTLALVAPALAKAADAAAGKETYDKKCASCHGADGKGDAKMEAKLKLEAGKTSLAKMSEKSDADLQKLMNEGKKPMPAYAGKLDAAAIDNVLAYAKSLVK